MPQLNDVIVLLGPDLVPTHCARFEWAGDTITAIEPLREQRQLDSGSFVVFPGMVNGHTHIGDSFLPDGATGLTLEEGFFRPNGYKYRELSAISREAHLPHVIASQRYMARTGTVLHLDFREQGADGAAILRDASRSTGVDAVILGQFNSVPFGQEELDRNDAALPARARAELDRMLEVADGFSESTMNDLTDPAWREIRSITSERGRLRAIHCLENAGYRDVSIARTGRGDLVQALELLDPDLIVHLTVANSAEIALLAASGKTAAINPRANANLALPLPPVHALLHAGVNLLLGTDNGLLNSFNLLAELDFTYKLAKSQAGDPRLPDPTDILRMATTNAHALLGPRHYGRIEKGLPATFVIADFHHPHLRRSRNITASLVTRATPEDIVATYREGRCLHRSPDFNPA